MWAPPDIRKTFEFSSNIKEAAQKETGWVTWKLNLLVPSQDDIMRKHLLLGHTAHCMPRKQLPGHCCLRFWFMDNLTQSTKPTASVDNNSLSRRQREGHPAVNEVQCQPLFFFYSFLLGSGVAGPPLSGGCGKRGRKILSHQGVHPVNWPSFDVGSIQPSLSEALTSPSVNYPLQSFAEVCLWCKKENGWQQLQVVFRGRITTRLSWIRHTSDNPASVLLYWDKVIHQITPSGLVKL